MNEQSHSTDEALLDLANKSDDELRELIDMLLTEEHRVSYRRRVLHGQIDILRAELVGRMAEHRREGKSAITGEDVKRLVEVLSQDLRGGSRFDVSSDEDDVAGGQ